MLSCSKPIIQQIHQLCFHNEICPIFKPQNRRHAPETLFQNTTIHLYLLKLLQFQTRKAPIQKRSYEANQSSRVTTLSSGANPSTFWRCFRTHTNIILAIIGGTELPTWL